MSRFLCASQRLAAIKPLFGLALLTCAAFAATPAHAQMYDAAQDFSASSNPSGVWSYGNSASLGSTFQPFTNEVLAQGMLDTWYSGNGTGGVEHNGTGQVLHYGSQFWQPGGLSIHNGYAGQYGIVRFTAPATDTYTLDSSFYAGDVHANVTVFVLADSIPVFNSVFQGNTPANYSSSLFLTKGETVDFAVGGYYYSGDAGLKAVLAPAVSPVPEASSLTSLGLLLCLGGVAVRRRRTTRSQASSA